MPKGLSRSTQGHANRTTEPPPPTKAADEAEVLPQLKEAGVAFGAEGAYQLTTDSFKFREHLKRTMKRNDARDELIQGLADSWEDASSLRQALSPMRMGDSAAAAAGDGVKDSLVRMLLQVDPLQTELANMLFEKLGELQADMDTDGNSMPLPRLIISQFRWLEHVVDGEALINAVSQTLQVIDAPLQKELVLVLPDLVTDDQHAAAVDMLSELLRKDNQFTAPVLDSLGSLQLNPAMLKQVNDTVTESVASANPQDLPMVIRFLLQHMTAGQHAKGVVDETAKDVVGSLRGGLGLDMLEPDGDTTARPGQPGGETLVLDAVQSALRLRKDLTNLVLKQLDAVARGGYRAIDWWLICALHSTSMAKAKPKVTKLVTSKAAKQQLTPQLLRAAVVGHGAALRPYYATHLELAGQLLRATDATARQLGRSLYVMLLQEFGESYDRQELIGCLLTHVGSGNEPEVDAALQALVELSTEHTAALSQFSAFLTGVLDHLDALTLLQARLVFDLFARLACDAPDASRLPDELAIIIRKQLTNANVKYKRLGVLGGCCLLSRIGARRDGSGAECTETERAESSRAGEEAGGPQPMDAPRIEQAREMLELMLKNSTAADGSRGFLLRELSRMVAARDMRAVSSEVVDMLAERVTTYFESDYMADVETLPLNLLVHGLRAHLTLGLDPEPSITVNLLPLLRTSECPAAQRHKLNSLSSTFELLRVCEAAVASGDDGLEAVDAVLGCPLILFDQSHLKDFNALPDAARSTACLALFYAVDWLRELLNAFATQTDPELRTKVVERLHQLRWLELELDGCLSHTPHFRLPGDTGALFKPKAVKAPTAKKQKAAAAKRRKAGSEVDSSENETDAEAAVVAEAPKDEGGKGKGKATEGGAASKARGKPTAAGAHFARLAPQLRPLSLETSRILTYAGTPTEGQGGEAAEFLRPAAVHYLLSQLHSTLKATLAVPSRFPGRPSASGGGGAHDTSGASELRALSGTALLRRIEPAVYSFREHAQTLLELLPQVHLPSSHQEYRPNLDDKASFSAEPEDLHRPHVEPALRLLLKCLLLLVEAPQLRDAESEPRLLRMLAHLGSLELPEHHNGALSKASGAEACAAAFDFFLTLRPELPSLGAAHELMVLERAILRLQNHVCGGADHVPEASLRQDGLATLADSILSSPPVERGESKAGPNQLVIADLFKCHVNNSDKPLELLATWTEELLPELEGAPDAAVNDAPLLKKGTVPAFLKVLFPLLIQEMGKLPLPKPEKKPQGKGGRRRTDPEEAAQLLEGLHKLVTAFESLVKSTKHFESEAVLTVALKASAEFLTLFNARALPFISANFLSFYTEAVALIKHVQPSTRLLQTHCTSVKQRMATGAAAAIPKLKRQLEELIFTVKVILKENDCAEGFWMGNLKHKNSKGEEVSSQMQVEVKQKQPKKAAKPKKRKKAEAEAEEEGEEGGEEGEEGGAQADDEAEDDAAPTDDEDAVQETMQEMEDEDEGEVEGEDQDAYPNSMIGDEEDEDE